MIYGYRDASVFLRNDRHAEINEVLTYLCARALYNNGLPSIERQFRFSRMKISRNVGIAGLPESFNRSTSYMRDRNCICLRVSTPRVNVETGFSNVEHGLNIDGTIARVIKCSPFSGFYDQIGGLDEFFSRRGKAIGVWPR